MNIELTKAKLEALKFRVAYMKEKSLREQFEKGIQDVQIKFNKAIIVLTDEIRILRGEKK